MRDLDWVRVPREESSSRREEFSGAERRRFGRFRIAAGVQYGFGHENEENLKDHVAISHDIGQHGARLIMKEPVHTEKFIFLVFHLPESIHRFKVVAQPQWQAKTQGENGEIYFVVGVSFFVMKDSAREVNQEGLKAQQIATEKL